MPRLRLDILKAIEKVNTCPLVLHGGSANRDEEIAEACRHGICKVNIASDVRKAFFQGTKEMLIETDAFGHLMYLYLADGRRKGSLLIKCSCSGVSDKPINIARGMPWKILFTKIQQKSSLAGTVCMH